MNVADEEESDQDSSQREKEIVGCVVIRKLPKNSIFRAYGHYTPPEHYAKITDSSAAGLTIYAIVNKLVGMSEVKNESLERLLFGLILKYLHLGIAGTAFNTYLCSVSHIEIT